MLESPDYFFRVREIGRLRQTTFSACCRDRNDRLGTVHTSADSRDV